MTTRSINFGDNTRYRIVVRREVPGGTFEVLIVGANGSGYSEREGLTFTAASRLARRICRNPHHSAYRASIEMDR